MSNSLITVQPQSGRFESLEQAVLAGGGELCDPSQARGLVWADAHRAHEFPDVLAQCPNLTWVALPFAGIEPYVPYLDDRYTWTCGKGVYAKPVAEHVLACGLAGLRGLGTYSQAKSWQPPQGTNLLGANVTIFGAGGITTELIRLLKPFECEISVVRRQAAPLAGAAKTFALEDRIEPLASADLVVLALALTDATRGVIGEAELQAMQRHAWLVNVARGGHIQTSKLVAALEQGELGGAALDVTDPEPLPEGHRLWELDNVIITPHVGNTPEMGIPLLADHIRDNVARFGRGETLDGLVDVAAGY